MSEKLSEEWIEGRETMCLDGQVEDELTELRREGQKLMEKWHNTNTSKRFWQQNKFSKNVRKRYLDWIILGGIILAVLVSFGVTSIYSQITKDGEVIREDDQGKDEFTELRKENQKLLEEVAEYKRLEEDQAARRIFEKARKQLIGWITFGGLLIAFFGFIGTWSIYSRAKSAAVSLMKAIAYGQMPRLLKNIRDSAWQEMQEQMEGLRESFEQQTKTEMTKITELAQDKMKDLDSLARQQKSLLAQAAEPISIVKDASRKSLRVDALESPKEIDYTESMLPVRNQGHEGSVVGFALAYALEYQIHKELAKKIRISPRYIYYYARERGGFDVGARITDAVQVLSEQGAVAEEVWPYLEAKPGEAAEDPPRAANTAEHYRIEVMHQLGSLDSIREALETLGPVVAGFPVFNAIRDEEVRRTGIFSMPDPSERSVGGHAVCIVGYNDDKQQLKFVNSWGNEWGNDGYGYITYPYAERFFTSTWSISGVEVVTGD